MSAERLVMFVDKRRIAVDLAAVEEIAECSAVTALPQLPAMVSGVVDVRGRTLPLIDLRAADGVARVADGRSVVVVSDGRRPFALLIDEVDRIVDEQDGTEDVTSVDVRTLLENIR